MSDKPLDEIHSSDFEELENDNDFDTVANCPPNTASTIVSSQNKRSELDAEESAQNCKRLKTETALEKSSVKQNVLFTTELWLKIFSCLSAMDLSSVSSVCVWFRELADDAALWRRLYLTRYHPSHSFLDETSARWKIAHERHDEAFESTWKMLYYKRDREEAEYLFRTGTPEVNDLLKEILAARRSVCVDVPCSFQLFTKRPLPSIEFLSMKVKTWLKEHGFEIENISEIPWWSRDHGPFVHIDDTVLCEKCGCVHICDSNCQHQLLLAREHVCPISGRTFTRMVHGERSDHEQDDEDNDCTNYLGNAFMAGYYGTAEDELRRSREFF